MSKSNEVEFCWHKRLWFRDLGNLIPGQRILVDDEQRDRLLESRYFKPVERTAESEEDDNGNG